MDIQRLEYFYQLSQTGSIKEASELLHITPAALSKAIKLLESELDTNLITPQGRGITLTEEGEIIAKNAKPLLTHVQDFRNNPLGEERKNENLRIGSFEVFTGHLLSQILHKIPAETNIEVRELIPGELEEALIKKHIDIGLTYLPIPKQGIEFLKIGTIEMGIYGQKQAFKNTAVEDMPFVVPLATIDGAPSKVKGLDGWPDDKVPRSIRYRVGLLESALELSRKGDAVCFVPKVVIEEHNRKFKKEYQLSEFNLPKNLKPKKHSVYLVKRKTTIEHKLINKVSSALRGVLRDKN